MALSIPLLDVGLAVVRRFLRRQPIFTADRGHIHHRLLDRGLSPRQVALALYAICSFVAIFSLLYSRSHNNQVSSVIVLIFCAVAWMGIQYLGYAEFTLAGRLLFRGDLQRALKIQLDLHAFDRALLSVDSPESCVKLVTESARQFGFKVVGLQIAGETFTTPFGVQAHHWQARISFDHGDFVELARDSEDLPASAASGPFLDTLRVGLREKLPAFSRAASVAASDSRATAW
jgi:UDP-GlcNAc:undecaprenyl-phosphate GlcNAc-1-phosphate transferase